MRLNVATTCDSCCRLIFLAFSSMLFTLLFFATVIKPLVGWITFCLVPNIVKELSPASILIFSNLLLAFIIYPLSVSTFITSFSSYFWSVEIYCFPFNSFVTSDEKIFELKWSFIVPTFGRLSVISFSIFVACKPLSKNSSGIFWAHTRFRLNVLKIKNNDRARGVKE